MTTTAPEAPAVTSQTWAGHWHGFGPWLGSPDRYAREGNRRPPHLVRPAADADHATRYQEAAGEFATSSLPPLMTGHWMAKKGQAAADRTWTDVTDAVEWLKRHYTDQPPFERSDGLQAYVGLDGKLGYAFDVLPRGWTSPGFTTPSRGACCRCPSCAARTSSTRTFRVRCSLADEEIRCRCVYCCPRRGG